MAYATSDPTLLLVMQVYKGVLSPGEYNAMTEELTSGPCIAFEVADRDGADSVEPVRELEPFINQSSAQIERLSFSFLGRSEWGSWG